MKLNRLKIVKGLHQQFLHQSEKVTEDLMRQAGVLTPELKRINQNVVKDCKIRKRYKKTRPRPVASLPLARRFNEVIAIDLKVFNGSLYVIHFIDLLTRFSRAQVIHRETPRNCGECLYNKLDSRWSGDPEKVLVNNGGKKYLRNKIELLYLLHI